MNLGPLEILFGFIILAAFVRVHFDRPCAARTYTTLGWYTLGMALYALIPVALFVVVAWRAPQASFLVLCIVLLVPMVPGIARLHRSFRRFIHRLVGIPTMAQCLGETLAKSELHVSDRVREECKIILLRRGFNPDDNWLPAAEPMRELWVTSFALFHQVRSWEAQPKYRRFLESTNPDFDILRRRFDQLSLKTVRVLHTVERLGVVLNNIAEADSPGAGDEANESAAAVRSVVSDILSDVREDIAFFHHTLCGFVARGILSTTKTKPGRERSLRKLGFKVGSYVPSVPSLLLWALACYLLVFIGFMGFHDSTRLLRPIMISTIQVVSIALVLLSKRAFGFANEDIHGRAPYGFIVGAGLAAAAVAAPIQWWFSRLIRDDTLPLSGQNERGPLWLIVTALTASMIAFLIQDRRWHRIHSTKLQRLLDALCFGAVTILSMEIVVQLLGAPSRLSGIERLGVGALLAALVGPIVPLATRQNAGKAPSGWRVPLLERPVSISGAHRRMSNPNAAGTSGAHRS